MKILLVAVHGILTRQTTADWPDRLDAWCAHHAPGVEVLKKEYTAGPFPLWNVFVRNPRLARGLAAEIELFANEFGADLEIHFVAHSNGTDVALQTIRALADEDIDTKTFVALGSILPADIAKNGIGQLMRDEHLDRAVAYVSSRDEAVHIGSLSLGYGDLGRTGWRVNGVMIPTADDSASSRVAYRDLRNLGHGGLVTRRFDGYGHGDYFSATNIAATFQRVLRDCGLEVAP